MIIIIPVCKKDIEAALRNLAWVQQLNPVRQNFTCYVARESTFVQAGSVMEAARRCFSDVKDLIYAPYRGRPTWPAPQNYAFSNAALYIVRNGIKEPWLWWEQDAIPLKPDWLVTLSNAHRACGKPFMGAVGASDNPNAQAHLNGVAIYPPEACRSIPILLQPGRLPFDVAGGHHVMKQAHVSPLFQHVWSWDGPSSLTPPTFRSGEDMARIHPDAVLFHRCKDSSLIERLSVSLALHEPSAPEPKPSLLQTLMRWKYGTGKWMVGVKNSITSIPKKLSSVRFVHCLERHNQSSADGDRRVEQAQESWVALYKTGTVIPAHVWNPDRNSEQIGDSRRLPFLKDVLVAGLNAGRRNDHVFFTNDDTILHPLVCEYLAEALKTKGAISSFRINFEKGGIPSLSKAPEDLVNISHGLQPKGDQDLGRDLFAFRKDWLRDHWHQIPDFLLGELEWDLVLSYLIRKDAGIHTTKFNMDKVMPQCEMPKGYVLHERHNRLWTSQQFEAATAKTWNRKLATEFYCDNNMHSLVTNQL